MELPYITHGHETLPNFTNVPSVFKVYKFSGIRIIPAIHKTSKKYMACKMKAWRSSEWKLTIPLFPAEKYLLPRPL